MKERNLSFAVIGAGMSGILSGIKLMEAGFTDLKIYEKADRVGGTCSIVSRMVFSIMKV